MKQAVKTVVVFATVAVLSAGVAMVSGCETTKGAGKDIQNASESTEKAIKGN